MKEGTAVSKRMEELAAKQGEISETQHRIMQEQLGKKAVLPLTFEEEPDNGIFGPARYSVAVTNKGNGSCQQLHWEVSVPWEFVEMLDVPAPIQFVDPPDWIQPDDMYRKYMGIFSDPVFPRRSLTIFTFSIRVNLTKERLKVPLQWEIISDDGRFPTNPDEFVFEVITAEPAFEEG